MRIEVGYKCRKAFIPFHTRHQRWACIVAHRRAGKTYAAIHDVLDHALRTDKPEARFALGAPTYAQVKDVMWTYLKRAVRDLPQVTVNESELWVQLHNKARIRLYALDTSYERMRGIYLDGIVMDEYADIDPKAWDEVIRPALSDRKGWAVWIGTSKGRNAFYKVYASALTKPEEWYVNVLRASETGIIDAAELADAQATMPDSVFNREYECSFDEPDINQLISGTIVREAQKRTTVRPEGPRLLGVDIARFGDDRTVIVYRDGDKVTNIDSWKGLDTMTTVGRISDAIQVYHPDAVFVDVIGVGAGVVDRLRQLRYPIIDVVSGAAAMDSTRYANLRAEMWFKLAVWIKDRAFIPTQLDLENDLTAVTYRYDSRNRIILESKEDMKKRNLPSPDVGDALAMTFAQPVAPKDIRSLVYGQQQAQDYDPFTPMPRPDSREDANTWRPW